MALEHINSLVSIYIPTHNRAELVNRAVLSALKQTYKNIEVIVVNDGSTDNTDQVIEELQKSYSNLFYFKLEKPKGACAARNLAIENAKGEFITGLDDDDQFLPQRVEELLKVYSDEYACVLSCDAAKKPPKEKFTVFTYDDLLWDNYIGNQVLTKTALLKQIGGFDENLTAAQDYDTWIRLLEIKPKALRLNKRLQIMDFSPAVQRITTSKKKFHGNFSVYKKTKHKLSRKQRAYQLFKLRWIQKKKIHFWKIWKLSPRMVQKRYIKSYIRQILGKF